MIVLSVSKQVLAGLCRHLNGLISSVTLLLLMFSASASAIGEKLAMVGMNSSNPDSISFVAIEEFSMGQRIYFTDNEFDGAGAFYDADEGVWQYTPPSGGLPVGGVVKLQETGPSTNVLAISCSFSTGAGCGTIVVVDNTGIDSQANPNVSIAGSDAIYAYSDSDTYPANGVTGVYAGMIRDTFVSAPSPGVVQNVSPLAWGANPESPVVVQSFGASVTHRDFKNAQRTNATIGQLTSAANFDTGAAFSDLDLTGFTFSDGTNPELSISVSPGSVVEDAAANLIYTLTLTPAPTSPVTVNFSVGGTATLTTDYMASSSGTLVFNVTNGNLVVPTSGSATFTVDPVVDNLVEPLESIVIAGLPSSGYDLGATNVAVGSIQNDDTDDSPPLVALSGLNHTTQDGFSFVALTDLSAGEVIYFTDKAYDNTSLLFTGAESVVKWVAPSGVQRGDVIVVIERLSPNINSFDIVCTDGSGTATCGVVTLDGGTSFSISGEEYYAVSDTDNDPNNGVTQIHAVLNTRGPVIPSIQDPSAIFQRAVVVSNFDSVFPGITNEDRVEYKFAGGERAASVGRSSFTNINNWIYAGTPQTLSSIPFADINIGQGPPVPRLAVAVSAPGAIEDAGGSLTYTFTLDSVATADMLVNFTISGTATTGADYSVGATSPLTLLSGQTTTDLVISPVADTDLEPDESIIVSVAAGVGYEPATISSVTADIVNDDIGTSMPIVSIVGVNSINPDDGIAFVALEDLAVGTEVYFTDRVFDRTSLSFPGTGDSVFLWTAPSGVNKGDVYAFNESPAGNDFDPLTCSDGSGAACGTISLESGSFTFSSSEPIYAYSDTDNEPNNGISEVYSVTYPPAGALGVIPDLQNPQLVYPNALVMDQFALTTSSLYEFDATKRSATVTPDDLQDTARPTPGNWVVETTTRALSTVRFDNIAQSNVVNLSASANSATESAATVITLTATAAEPVIGAQMVSVAASGTGIAATDYLLSASTITIADGATTGSVTFTVVDDALVEALTETATISVSNPSAGIQLGDTTSVMVSITDNDSATISIDDVQLNESNTGTVAAQFTVTLSAAVDTAVSMTANTVNGTATTVDSDYAAVIAGTVQFAANSNAGATQTFDVSIVGDTKVELDETLTLSLSAILASGRDVTFSDSEGTLRISNDDAASVSINDVTQNEGDSGNTSFDFAVSLSAPVDAPVSLAANTSDGTATTAAGDYTAVSAGSVLFTANSMAGVQQTVTVSVIGDETVELDEAFSVVLSSLSASGRNVSILDDTADATISNDDSASVSIADVGLAEGDSGANDMEFTVTLDASVDADVSMTFTTIEGSAVVADLDFNANSGSVTFLAGSLAGTTQSMLVGINGDTKLEANETLTVELADLTAGARDVSFSNAQAVGTILNDDVAQITLSTLDTAQDEGNDLNGFTSYAFSATLDNAVQGGFGIEFQANDGLATLLNNDYVANSGTLDFSGEPGEVQMIRVDVNHDDQIEVDEDFSVSFGHIVNLAIGIDAHAISADTTPLSVSIINDDFDQDTDGVLDRNDNCPMDSNTDQADADNDQIGDVCDADLDGDGADNVIDNCPIVSNEDQADLDGDGLGNNCDDDIDGDQLPNDYEIANGLDPFNSFDQRGDADGDGFNNLEEFRFGSDPNVFDTDDNNNGVPDSIDRRRAIAPTIIPTIILPLLLDDAA